LDSKGLPDSSQTLDLNLPNLRLSAWN